MFLYLMAIIPCHWTAKTQILDCVASSEDRNTACLQTITGSATLHQVTLPCKEIAQLSSVFMSKNVF